MLAIVHACAIIGLDGSLIEVQNDFNPRAGIPQFIVVGLPDAAVRESRERVRSAIRNSGLQFPNKQYTVNLSPADLPKHSTSYDLAIAVSVLAATDQAPLPPLEKALFVGELSLDGTVRHVNGALSMAYAAQQAGFEAIYLPEADAAQAALVDGVTVYPVQSLGQLVEHLYGLNPIAPYQRPPVSAFAPESEMEGAADFADIKGQEYAKRALEIAAAGGHNVLLSGPPGAGKTLLARSIPGILPKLGWDEALEVTRIYSVADLLRGDRPLMTSRPFRAPHHTISQAGLIGGGSLPRPGEVTLSHRGVLFLDEAVELPVKVLEVMRQPIEDKQVTISRAKGTLTFPASFLLVLAMNPCPCGFYGDPTHPCTCSPSAVSRYQGRLSGPLLDRIDIFVSVPRVEHDKLMSDRRAEPSAAIRARVEAAREQQRQRFNGQPGLYTNSDMTVSDIQAQCVLSPEARQLLEVSVRKLQLSGRGYHRTLKLARTIADLAASERIEAVHVAEAVSLRPQQMFVG
jgi:magnesium chelatase family protein